MVFVKIKEGLKQQWQGIEIIPATVAFTNARRAAPYTARTKGLPSMVVTPRRTP